MDNQTSALFPQPTNTSTDTPITFVISELDVHLFVPETFEASFVLDIANNFR